MTGAGVAFLVAAAVTLLAAYRVVTARRIMHAALWLGLTFFGVAAEFLLLDADFLAAAQVLIYIGAVTTIIIFGIMLSDPSELGSGTGPDQALIGRAGLRAAAFVVAGGLACALIFLVTSVTWPAAPAVALANTPLALGTALFGKYVIPFEIASVVLLVALIGAVVLAMREEL